MRQPSTLSVLIVDDYEDAADSLASILSHEGYQVRTAYSAKQAGHIVYHGFQPSVLLMELGLPEMDGFAVARELRAALPARPLVIAITGYHHLGARAKHEGFDLLFLKPVEPEMILELLLAYQDRRG